MTKYIAVAGQDEDTCEALGWAALSVRPYVVAEGDDREEVEQRAVDALGHDDVTIHATP